MSANPGTAGRSRWNPLQTVGIGLIGVGSRGKRHLTEVIETPGTRIVAVCDIFSKRLDWAVETARRSNPDAKGYADYRELLQDPAVDAVIIATPDHWHSRMTIDGANAKKDIYVQKCLTRTVEEATAMVQAVKRNGCVLQLGHTRRSEPIYHQMKQVYGSGLLGQVSVVDITMFRNSASGAWDWEIEAEGNPGTINWVEFLGDAPAREFDPERYFRWRKFWDYGTGISGDLLSHEWDAVNFVMDLGIPASCIASGGVYYWKERREVPDVFSAVYEYPHRGLSVLWNCTFSNSAYGINTGTHLYGKNATLKYDYSGKSVDVFLEPHIDENSEIMRELRDRLQATGSKPMPDCGNPVYSLTRNDHFYVTSHFENFIDCVRSRERTRCNEDEAFEEAVTSVMSVIAYKEQRPVSWDPVKQILV